MLLQEFESYSPRYDKSITCPKFMLSDGATWAIDIVSAGWWPHDRVCVTGVWDDKTPITNWQASFVLSDILRREGRTWRSVYWFIFTFAVGCEKARENGMFRLRGDS